MLSLPSAVRIFLCMAATDMRRSFDGLAVLAESVVREDPYSGHLFVFRNKRGDRVKVLYWDGDGYAIWYKRLEEGQFRFPEGKGGRLEVGAAEWAMILEGIEPGSKRQRRYARPKEMSGVATR